jgi:hypothetical protein
MASYNNYSDSWYVTVNGGTGTVYLDASLQVNGNITYVSQLEVNDAFIIAAANNSSAANVTAVGLLAGKPTTPISYAGIQYNAIADAWQISTNVFANGVANTAYANISTYGDANVVALLSAFGSNTISTTGTINSGNIVAANVIVGNVTTNLIRSNDSSYLTVQDGLNVIGDIEVSGIITTNLIRSNDSSYLTVQDGLNVIGDIEVSGNITGGNLNVAGQISATGNITGGNLITSANVVFGDGSKFTSASWTLVETITGDLSSGDVNVSTTNSFSYYSSRYNEVLYATSYNNEGGTITLPVTLVTNNTVWVVNDYVGIKWANIANNVITLVDITSPTYSTTVYMYAR